VLSKTTESGKPEDDCEAVCDRVEVAEAVCVGDPERDGVTLGVDDDDPDKDCVSEAVCDCDTVCEGVMLGVGDCDAMTMPLRCIGLLNDVAPQ